MAAGHALGWTAPRLFAAPRHPYTRALLAAVPVPDPDRKRSRIVLEGDLPDPQSPPPGCPFHTRCPEAKDVCRAEIPPWKEPEQGHRYRCHFDF